jgi:hypothetical protein
MSVDENHNSFSEWEILARQGFNLMKAKNSISLGKQ